MELLMSKIKTWNLDRNYTKKKKKKKLHKKLLVHLGFSHLGLGYYKEIVNSILNLMYQFPLVV